MLTPWQYLTVLASISSVSAVDYTFTPFKRDLTSRSTVAEVLPKAQFNIPLQKAPRSSTGNTKSLAQRIGRTSYTTTLAGIEDVGAYVVSATIGGQAFSLLVDSGSSDTWVPLKGFSCVSPSGEVVPESECGFDTDGFDPSLSSTYTAIPGKNFNVTYGFGAEFLTGTVAEETITVGGMTVKKQVIGIGTHVAWSGDSVMGGLLGLALPDLTSVYNGTNPGDDSVVTNKDVYNPFFVNAFAEGAVTEPYFSMSLDRGSVAEQTNSTEVANLGYLAFGGIVDVPVTGTTVTVPIQGFTATGTDKTDDFWYTIDVDSYNFPGAPAVTSAGLTPFVDSGTYFMYLPSEVAQTYNEAMDPPATNSEEYGGYVMDCNATAPPFSLTIGGKTFTVSAKDIIIPMGITVNGTALCISGIQAGGFTVPVPIDTQTIYVLGDVFLHNVVVTYNVETPSLTITQREAY